MSVVSVPVWSPPNFLLTKCTGAVTTAAEVEATFSAVRQPQTATDSRKAIAPARVIVRCYQPAEDTPGEEPGPVYDDNNAPTFKDLVKAAHRARKGLKELKP